MSQNSSNNVGTVTMNLTLNTKGFNNSLTSLQNSVSTLSAGFTKVGKVIAAAFSINILKQYASECMSLYDIQEQAEVKLQTIMKQRMNATNENIQAIKDYASELQGIGILGDEVLLSGGQQLASFLNSQESLKTLMSAMANLTAQQKGVNATYQDAVTYANQLGKAMANNSLSSLTKTGITVSDEEEATFEALTNEEEKAAYLANIITKNVGNMNEALANTPTGKITQMNNAWGDLKETIGSIAESVLASISTYLTIIINKINSCLQAFSKLVSMITGTSGLTGQITSGLSDASDEIANSATSAGDAATAITRAVAKFDELNKVTDTSSSSSGSGGVDTSSISSITSETTDTESALDALQDKIDQLKASWASGWKSAFKADTSKLLNNLKRIQTSLKSLFGDSDIQNALDSLMNNIASDLGSKMGMWASIGTSIGTWITGGIANSLEENSPNIKNWFLSMITQWNNQIDKVKEFRAAVSDLFTVFEGDNATNLLGNIISIFGNVFGTITLLATNFVTDLETLLFQPFIDNVEGIKEALDGYIGDFNNIISGVKDVVLNLCNDLLALYDEHISPLIQSLTESLSLFVQSVVDGYNEYLQPVLEHLSQKSEDLVKKLNPIIDNLTEIIGNLFDCVKIGWDTYLSPFIDWVLETIMPTLSILIDVLGEVGLWMGDNLFDAINVGLSGLNVLSQVLEGLVQVTADVFDAFISLKDSIVDTFTSIPDAIKSAINGCISLVNSMIDSINKISIDVPSITGGEGKHIGFNINHIPALAEGGYVGPNNPQLVQIGDNSRYGEIVANDKQLESLQQSIINGIGELLTNQGSQPVYLSVEFGNEDITDLVSSSITKYNNITGKRIL